MNRITQYYQEHGCDRDLFPSALESQMENHRLNDEIIALKRQRNWLLLSCAVLVLWMWR